MQPHDTTSATKTCTKCGETKPLSEFSKHRGQKDGLQSQCKGCHASLYAARREEIKTRVAAYAATHKEEIKTRGAAYRAKHKVEIKARRAAHYATNKEKVKARVAAYAATHKERVAAYRAAYYAAHKEEISAQQAAYYETNKERINARTADYYAAHREETKAAVDAWRKANPHAVRALKHKRRALTLQAEGTHTAADIEAQYKRQRGRCYYCGEKVGKTYDVDHVVPLSRGGTNDPDNLVIACASCNRSKSDKLPSEWPQGGRLL